ncbi:hypothetical protein M9458_005672, partial [Cirrhinus mrigala]
ARRWTFTYARSPPLGGSRHSGASRPARLRPLCPHPDHAHMPLGYPPRFGPRALSRLLPLPAVYAVLEAIDPPPSSCPSPVPGGYRLAHSSSYSPLQGRGGCRWGAGWGTPFMDLFCETCSKPWLIG